jgi:hypothetical protein
MEEGHIINIYDINNDIEVEMCFILEVESELARGFAKFLIIVAEFREMF